MERTCTAEAHGTTDRTWIAGCRCRAALRAHAALLEKRRGNCVGPAVGPDGSCIATQHGTTYAYKVYGCRCDEAVKANRERAKRKRERIAARTPKADPRVLWRGPDWRVDRLTLRLLVAGVRMVGTPTRGEMLAAMIVLRGRFRGYGQRPVLNDAHDIAGILGITEKAVQNLDAERKRRRECRARRRAADAEWRARRAS